MALVYSPEEDSYLLQKVLIKKLPLLLKNNPILKFLEIGCGTGIQLETALKLGVLKKNIFSVDKNIDAVKICQKKGFHSMKSDLFSNIKKKYDVIVFNPPYLPFDKKEDKESSLITSGGMHGGELINKFLKQVKNNLNENGKIYLLISSLTKDIDWQNWEKTLVGKEKLFFEKLEVWELSNSKN